MKRFILMLTIAFSLSVPIVSLAAPDGNETLITDTDDDGVSDTSPRETSEKPDPDPGENNTEPSEKPSPADETPGAAPPPEPSTESPVRETPEAPRETEPKYQPETSAPKETSPPGESSAPKEPLASSRDDNKLTEDTRNPSDSSTEENKAEEGEEKETTSPHSSGTGSLDEPLDDPDVSDGEPWDEEDGMLLADGEEGNSLFSPGSDFPAFLAVALGLLSGILIIGLRGAFFV